MADFWNQRAMMPPATCNIPYSADEQRKGKCIVPIVNVKCNLDWALNYIISYPEILLFADTVIRSLQVVVEVLASFDSTSEAYQSLGVESHLLSGLIYRSNNQFRSDKRLQLMKRVNWIYTFLKILEDSFYFRINV